MSKVLIIYGSTTGNTEQVAGWIGAVLKPKGHVVRIKNVTDARVEDLEKDHDLILLGVSTWGDDGVEFQEDFVPFYKELDRVLLTGRKVALFGCGDSGYEHFCGALDLLEAKMEELGAIIVNEPLRIDGEPIDVLRNIMAWAEDVGGSM
jgi:flavodoxin I